MNEKTKNIVLWVCQCMLAAMFLFAGGMKLVGPAEAVSEFRKLGVGQWFRYLTGVIEIGSAVLLLIPSLSGIGALLLVPTMLGAVLAHYFILGGSPIAAFVMLVIAIGIVFGRKEQIQSRCKEIFSRSSLAL